jgi:L-methionine (R)-S-oxide reductase
MNSLEKEARYEKTLPSIGTMIDGEDDLTTVLSTISCELYHAFEHWNWVGFYRRVDERTLKVGPYQGGHGCLTIDMDRGVCGACLREKSIIIIKDVSTVDDHIACSSDTKSEIVLPIIGNSGTVLAVFDLDSTEIGAFDEIDKQYLSKVVDWIRPVYDRHPSRYMEEN